MKRTAIALTLIMALLFLAVAGIQFVDLARANPFYHMGEIPPDYTTKPPKITIFSPENKTYAKNNVSFAFNVSAPKQEAPVTGLVYSPTPVLPIYSSRVEAVYYKADWQQDDQQVDIQYDEWHGTYLTEFSFNLTRIPEGNHSITVHAIGTGLYVNNVAEAYTFTIKGSSSVFFTIDTTSPIICFVPRK